MAGSNSMTGLAGRMAGTLLSRLAR
jgi:hypothetical protein